MVGKLSRGVEVEFGCRALRMLVNLAMRLCESAIIVNLGDVGPMESE